MKAAEQTQGNYHSDTAQAKRPLLLEERDVNGLSREERPTLLSGVKIQCYVLIVWKAGRDRKCPPDTLSRLQICEPG